MADWSNLRLVATGHAADLAPFRRAAGALRGRIDTSRSTVFTEEMEYGEGGDLETDGLERFDGDLRRASYRFQGRNDDHVDHFTSVSRRYPRLAFVLVVSDPSRDDNGSYLIRKGRRRFWGISERMHQQLFTKHLRKWGVLPEDAVVDFHTIEWEDEYVDGAFWDALFEEMDVSLAKWDREVQKWLRALPQPRKR